MKKVEFITNIVKKTGVKKVEVSKIVDAFLNEINKVMEKEDSITFKNFGTFSTVIRSKRKVRIPGSGEIIETSEKTIPKFKAGLGLKKAANKKKDIK